MAKAARLFDAELADLPAELRWREWMGRIEAAIFASPTPVPRETLAGLVGRSCVLDELIADIRDELKPRPYDLVFVAGGFQHRSKARFSEAIRTVLGAGEPGPPSLSKTESLVISAIAYLQPVTRASISRLLGKEISRDIIAKLKRLDLIGAGPRMAEPGAPFSYVTTPTFLSVFGFASLRDLPEIEAMQEAGLLDLAQDEMMPVDPLDDRLTEGDELEDDIRDQAFDAPDRLPAD
ncbi:MAG: SMC-Scp complex subunit ScpB [Beijerinckiaceae bacterium]|jgi:segregation and condensation protein B|uniref:SMC-Scp complex subunit ScpB n=1 Tax=Bosea eneae TaxID=151454 RepID=A0ABW0IZM5_9HYPH|nr:SMC-Scp complex subunit ScpB [Beijerinckiaceae bacterium]